PRRRAQHQVLGLGSLVLADQLPIGLETARREDDRTVVGDLAERPAYPYVAAGGVDERGRERLGVEAGARSQRIARIATHDACAQRLEPAEVRVQVLEHREL